MKHPYGAARDFLAALPETTTDDCIKWPFGGTRHGYGRVNFRGVPMGAHVASAILAHGPKPTPKHEACHRCGQGHRGCVNPRHIYWGTRLENVRDAMDHGTATLLRGVVRSGENAPTAKFSDAVVRKIRAMARDGHRKTDIAAHVGASKTYVGAVLMGKVRVATTDQIAT